ncbi:acyl carrier protein [Streptomyces sp. NPDC051577]|uniref:acyl carrier protein n=1 Tax=Streptomyces sp. NPDC051577 TaxID=3155166 RepID=UPI0034210589
MQYEDLVGLLARTFDADPAKLAPSMTLEQLNLDSLALVELALACNDQFDAGLDDTALTPEHRLTDVVTLLESG